jgi:ERCC4-type nuclease
MNVLDLLALVGFVIVLVLGAVDKFSREEQAIQAQRVERLKEKRVAGEISESEFERRLELHLDDETDKIRTAVEPIPGVGEELSKFLAERFDSLDELREADVEQLENVPGVGEQRAEAIQSRLSE